MSNLHPQSASFLDRVKAGAASSIDLKHLATWIERNTSHPKDASKPWSFKDHEYQIGIVNDDARYVCGQKCSQIGFSEMQARMLLGVLSVLRGHKAIYTMPTSGAAADFVKARIDPIIASSTLLRGLVDPELDNVKLKRVGTSYAYFLGTFTQKAAISTDADILITDEVNFSDPTTLTTYASRLGHREDGGIRRLFSTPTLPGIGISEAFELSSQAYYGVKCDHCHKWVFPNFMEHVIIPGFDESLDKFTKEDLYIPQHDINGAFLSCPECQGEISQSNLCDPSKRRWVHKYPSREKHGYQVFPYDVPTINPVPRTLLSIGDYARQADWVNFKVGLPFANAETSFLEEVVRNNTTVTPLIPPDEVEADPTRTRPRGFVLGCDVGKVSHIVVGTPTGRGSIDVVYLEEFKQTGDGELLKRLVFLVKWFGVSKGCIDAAPDFTTSMGFVAAFNMGRTYANYYTRAKAKSTLSHVSVNDAEGILSTVRTDSLDLLAKKVNSGQMGFPRLPQMDEMRKHLGALKRTEHVNNLGETIVNWVPSGPDHYGHALNYMNIAATLLEGRVESAPIPGALPMASITRLKQLK